MEVNVNISIHFKKFKKHFICLCALIIIGCNNEQTTKINIENTIPIFQDDTTNKDLMNIGVAAMLSPENALPVYREIVGYLGEKMNKKTKMIFTKDYATMNEYVKSKKVVVAFVCSGPYVQAHDLWGMELVAAPSMYGETTYYSYIIVNKGSSYSSLEDLKGKKFAFTDPSSNTGKLVPTYELSKNGTTPEEFFSEYIFTGSHDKSVEAVADNLVDGAAVDNLVWEYMNHSDFSPTSKTRVIAKLGPFCIPPIVVNPSCNDTIKKNIKKILLNMHNDPDGKVILRKLYMDKFVDVQDDCYQSIREMEEWINASGN